MDWFCEYHGAQISDEKKETHEETEGEERERERKKRQKKERKERERAGGEQSKEETRTDANVPTWLTKDNQARFRRREPEYINLQVIRSWTENGGNGTYWKETQGCVGNG